MSHVIFSRLLYLYSNMIADAILHYSLTTWSALPGVPIPAARFIIRVHPHPIVFITIRIGAPAPTSCVFSVVCIEAVEEDVMRSLPAMTICISRFQSGLRLGPNIFVIREIRATLSSSGNFTHFISKVGRFVPRFWVPGTAVGYLRSTTPRTLSSDETGKEGGEDYTQSMAMEIELTQHLDKKTSI